MHSLRLLLFDLSLVVAATLLSLILRENFELSGAKIQAAVPYILASLSAALVVFPSLGIHRAIWRFNTLPDYLRIAAASALIVAAALGIGFVYNRLDGVARSLPLIQGLTIAAALIGARVVYRLHHFRRLGKRKNVRPLVGNDTAPVRENVLVVGISSLTETYLRSVEEFGAGRVHVAGLLGRSLQHVGRHVGAHKILGVPEDIEEVIEQQMVHGVTIDKIVIATPFVSLSEAARMALLAVEEGGTTVHLLAEEMGLEPRRNAPPQAAPSAAVDERGAKFVFTQDELERLAASPYWRIKRSIDIFGAAILLVGLAIPMLVIGAAVAFAIGHPIAFWQERPGLAGRPFRLYKLRSMGPPRDSSGRRLSDEERTSQFGVVLRRTRLDELPQLFGILTGKMSFVGPRPLLPRDQSQAYSARLLVRPGLTGWAQVVGGRAISAEDKAALDVWYVRNASLMLDLEIIARTVPIVIFGERVSQEAITRAWQELCRAGVVKKKHQAVAKWSMCGRMV